MNTLRIIGNVLTVVGAFFLVCAMALIGLALQVLPLAFAIVIALWLLRSCS